MARGIYELTGDWIKFYNMADDPDMDEDSWFEMMESIEEDLETKAENSARVMKQLKAESDAIKAEADRLSVRAKSLSNKADRIKKGIETSMVATGKTKFKTEHFSFGIQKNPASLKFDDDFDIFAIPSEFVIHPAPEVDKKALKDAIANGQEFKGCHMEQSESIRIR